MVAYRGRFSRIYVWIEKYSCREMERASESETEKESKINSTLEFALVLQMLHRNTGFGL